ncbi:MAG: ATP synthase F1 subunit gamma [Phototrophicaceae bacterium]
MPSSREVKNRIRSVKNIGQITRALEAVSASRVRKAQARVLASRDYAYKAMEILMNIQAVTGTSGESLHPLLAQRESIENIMIVLVTSDRGLAGAFNTNIIRVAQRFAYRLGKPVQWVAVGRKGRDALIRAGEHVVAEFTDIADDLTISDIRPISRVAKDAFLAGEVDDVFISYTDFINTLTQRPAVLPWLPMVPHDVGELEHVKNFANVSATSGQDYEFEPNPQAIIDEIVPRFTDLILYQAYLESKASEHSARMVAMRNASDNAEQLVEDLTLVYNKARQAGITNEILDIVGGAEALQDTLDKKAAKLAQMAEAAGKFGAGAQKKKPAASPRAVNGRSDDLTRIEGIGPKISQALQSAGITTFAQLAQATEDQLTGALNAAGMRFAPSLSTWAKQAEFAASGDWDGLKAYQDELVAGREA